MAEAFLSRGQFTTGSPVDTVALRKRASVSLLFIPHGAEAKRHFPQSLLLPAPAAHSPLCGVGRGRRGLRGRGRSGIRGVLRVRDAGSGGVPSPFPSSPLSLLQASGPATWADPSSSFLEQTNKQKITLLM